MTLIGVFEARRKLVEEIANARIAMRLDDGDDASLCTAPRGAEHGRDLGRVMTVVVVDGDAVPFARQLEAPLDAGKPGHRRFDLGVFDAGLRRDRDRRERIEGIVGAGQRNGPAFEFARPALDARGQARIEVRRVALDAHRLQHEIAILALAVGQQPATVGAKIEALHHLTHDRMIDAGDSQAEERNVLQEDFVFAVHRSRPSRSSRGARDRYW